LPTLTIEEGAAEIFARYQMELWNVPPDKVGLKPGVWDDPSIGYNAAVAMVKTLLEIDREAIKKLRQVQPIFREMTPTLILEVLPTVPVHLAQSLCTEMEPYDVGEEGRDRAINADADGRMDQAFAELAKRREQGS
jgi:hypothetical protein